MVTLVMASCGCLVRVPGVPSDLTRRRIECQPCGRSVCLHANYDDTPAFSEFDADGELEEVGAGVGIRFHEAIDSL